MATINVDDAELREVVKEAAQRAAAEYLVNHTIPEYPAYFMETNWLVTYGWLQATRAQLEGEIVYLQQQINDLKRPWWKRWFSR